MARLDDILNGVKTVVISGHVRPDGDCVGSTLAAYTYIKDNYPEIQAEVYLEQVDDRFRMMPNQENIKLSKTVPGDLAPDLFLVFDIGDIERLGDMLPACRAAGKVCNVDHHISNQGCGDFSLVVSDASSTCEVLYSLLDPARVSKECAENLFLGLVHDTGVFKYSNVSKNTLLVAAELIDKGIRNDRIINETFNSYTYCQQQIMGRALLESVLFFDGKCIVSDIGKKEMEFYNVSGSELGAIVDALRTTKGVEVAIFMYEVAPLTYKVSLRSNYEVDVNLVASQFGGGGHVRAAGCTMRGTRYDVIHNLANELEKQLGK